MFDFTTIGQFPIGLAIGIASVMVPSLLRFLLLGALALVCLQAAQIYAAGGGSALAAAIDWVIALASSFAVMLGGIGLGRLAAELLFGLR